MDDKVERGTRRIQENVRFGELLWLGASHWHVCTYGLMGSADTRCQGIFTHFIISCNETMMADLLWEALFIFSMGGNRIRRLKHLS